MVAVTLELWADPENDGERTCCSAQAVRGARALAHARGCPTSRSTCARSSAPASSTAGWRATPRGQTPNPCVRCNGSVRLDAMLDLARRLGAERLVTGHYARVHQEPADPSVHRCCASPRDPRKDQSYVLAGLAPDSLARLRFPLGDLTKTEVREIAEQAGLSVARKPDSQDLCFLAGTGLQRFLARHGDLPSAPGGDPRRRRRPAGQPRRRPRLHHRPAPRPAHRGARTALRAGAPTRAPTPSPSAPARRCSRARWRCATSPCAAQAGRSTACAYAPTGACTPAACRPTRARPARERRGAVARADHPRGARADRVPLRGRRDRGLRHRRRGRPTAFARCVTSLTTSCLARLVGEVLLWGPYYMGLMGFIDGARMERWGSADEP